MPEQARKLTHFTNAVVQEAAVQTDRALRALEEKRNNVLRSAGEQARLDALHRIHAGTAAVQAEAGRDISRHLMECKRAISLRREEIAQEVFGKVVQRIRGFVDSPDYFDALEAQLIQAVEQFGAVSDVVVYLRPADLEFSSTLAQAIRPVHSRFKEAGFSLGGLIVDCPEIGQRIDASYDAAVTELSGHFAELFGLSLSDDLAGA